MSLGTRHLAFKYLSVRENVKFDFVRIDDIDIHLMIANLFTKGLPNGGFHGHIRNMGLVSSFDRLD